MAIVLTNGKYYIARNSKGKMVKVSDIGQAKDFRSVENAIKQKNLAPSKCAGFYYIDTSIDPTICQDSDTGKIKRKSFSANDRKEIYRKTKGHCYLCGEFVDFDSFEIDHQIPLAKGGTNDFENLFPSCHTCNSMKNSIYPEELLEKINQIFMYQMGKKHCGSVRWKNACKLLESMM